MIKIRLSKYGSRNQPIYRIVAISKNRKREGKVLDIIGYWFPYKNQKMINKEKLNQWLEKGAQITISVKKLL